MNLTRIKPPWECLTDTFLNIDFQNNLQPIVNRGPFPPLQLGFAGGKSIHMQGCCTCMYEIGKIFMEMSSSLFGSWSRLVKSR